MARPCAWFHRLNATAAILVVLGTCSLFSTQEPARTAQPQRFTTKTDLVLVDVSVVDRSGAPVIDLTAGDFTVLVDGKPRPIQSAQFVGPRPGEVHPNAATSAREASASSNALAASGRLLVIAVDEAHLGFGSNQAVVRTAASLMDRLAPGGLAAVARFPDGGGVEFTADRQRVRDALTQVAGRARQPPQLSGRVYLHEAVDLEAGGRYEWPRAIARECGNDPSAPGAKSCVTNLALNARVLLQEEAQKVGLVFRALERLIASLESVQSPATIVLISEGMYLGTEVSLVSRLSRSGAAGRITIHVVKPAPAAVDMREFGGNPPADDAIVREALGGIAGEFGGEVYSVAGTGEGAFDRIGLELAGSYLLGVETTVQDRAGRKRPLRVTVSRPGLSVRARSSFTVSESKDAGNDPEKRLQRLLDSPVPAPGLPLKVTTYATLDNLTNRVRVLVSAEIDDVATGASRRKTGLLVLNDKGQVVSTTTKEESLAPALDGAASGGLFITSFVVDPGDYVLRLASIGPDGRAGSVHHHVSAHPTLFPGEWIVSDLIAATEPPSGGVPRFNPASIVEGDRVTGLLELRHDKAQAVAGAAVRVEVVPPGSTRSIATAPATAREPKGARNKREFVAVLPLGGVPAGEYVLRALVDAPPGTPASVERRFRLEPGRAWLRGATRDLLLDPLLVRAVVDELKRRHPVSPMLDDFVGRVQSGALGDPPDAESRPPADVAMVTFVRGLSALHSGKIAVAQTLFQQTRRLAPDVAAVDAFLGMCHALNGRAAEAVDAWTAALARFDPSPADPELTFLGLHLLLQVHTARGSSEAERAQFVEWARQYDASGGRHLGLVATWRTLLIR